MLPDVLAGSTFETQPFKLLPGWHFHLKADALGMVFALLASFLWICTSVYSIGYMRKSNYRNQTSYYASFAICLSSTIGLAFAANLGTFFVFYEVLTLSTYPLVIHFRTKEARAAGRKYLAYTFAAGQMLLLAIILSAQLSPGAVFTPGGFLYATGSPLFLQMLFLLFLFGVGVKVAVVPLHGWLPSAMVAPTPVSALLHAVAVVKAGAFGCIRIVGFVFGIDTMRELHLDIFLALLACITIIAASLRALGETHLKRRLAYATVSQLSYIVLGSAIGSFHAVLGAIFHIAAHGVMKITLFFCAGSIYTQTHKDDIRDFGGLGRKMPITFGAFAIASLALGGMPILTGFISKWNLGIGAVEAGMPFFLLVLLASGLLNFAYFFPILHTAFFKTTEDSNLEDTNESSVLIWAPILATSTAIIILGVFPDFGLYFYKLAWMAAQSVANVNTEITANW